MLVALEKASSDNETLFSKEDRASLEDVVRLGCALSDTLENFGCKRFLDDRNRVAKFSVLETVQIYNLRTNVIHATPASETSMLTSFKDTCLLFVIGVRRPVDDQDVILVLGRIGQNDPEMVILPGTQIDRTGGERTVTM
jgi:hypothetical protein